MLKKILEKENILTILVALVCLVLLFNFRTENIFQTSVAALAFLAFIPAAFVKIALKRNLSDYGFQLGNARQGIVWSLLSFLALSVLIYGASRYVNFAQIYAVPGWVSNNFRYFMLNALLLVGIFSVLYEIFFRGFVLLGTEKNLKYWSIILQFALFSLLVFNMRENRMEMIYVLLAPFSGIIAYKSRSLAYPIVFSWIFHVLADALFIKFYM